MPVSPVHRVPRPAVYANRTIAPGGGIAPGVGLGRLLLSGWLAACLVWAFWTPPLLAQDTAKPSKNNAAVTKPVTEPVTEPVTKPVTESIPKPGTKPVSAAVTIAVLDFNASTKISGQSEAFSMRVREFLAKNPRYRVMERGQMNLALAVEKLWGKPCLEGGCAAAAGRALQVERVVVGELSLIGGKTWRATALMVEVKNEKTLAAQWINGEMEFEAFLAEKPGVLTLRLITGISSPGMVAVSAPPEEPKKPKKKRPQVQRKKPFRISLTFGEIQSLSMEVSDLTSGRDTFNENLSAIGVGLIFEWIFISKGSSFSLFTSFHYGSVDEVSLDDDGLEGNSGQKVSGVTLPVTYGASGIFSKTEIGLGVNWLTVNWRFHLNLTAFGLLAQYEFADAILSSGNTTGWEIKGNGVGAAFLFEYMFAKGITVGGILQSGRLIGFEGSRIDAYEKAGFVVNDIEVHTLGFRIGYGF